MDDPNLIVPLYANSDDLTNGSEPVSAPQNPFYLTMLSSLM